MSTLHHDKHIPDEDNPAHKPEIILHYNITKSGVDNLDHLCMLYSCKRAIRRWPMILFFDMLDIAAVAALVVWFYKFPDWYGHQTHRRRMYLKELGYELTQQCINQRLLNPRAIQKGVKTGLKTLGYEIEAQLPPTLQEPPRKRRCYMCPRKLDRKSQLACLNCQQSVCKQHCSKQVVCLHCDQNDGN